MTIRPADARDAEALARMRYEFRAELGEANEAEDAFVARCAAWMAARLAPGTAWRGWVLERDGEIAGTAWAELVEKIPNPVDEPEAHVYVTNCYVRASERGRGSGGALLDAVLAWCREIGAHAVVLWPSDRSRSLYARRGFAPRDDLFELLLTTGPAGRGSP